MDIPDLRRVRISEEELISNLAAELFTATVTVIVNQMGLTLKEVRGEAKNIAKGELDRTKSLNLPFRPIATCAQELLNKLKKLAEEKKAPKEPDNKEVAELGPRPGEHETPKVPENPDIR